jgi:hypothetical protein
MKKQNILMSIALSLFIVAIVISSLVPALGDIYIVVTGY